MMQKKTTQAIKGDVLAYPYPVALRYYKTLELLIRYMANLTQKEIIKLFESEKHADFFAQDASISSQARILMNFLRKKINDFFDERAKKTSEKMADEANQSSKANTKASLKELAQGLIIKTEFITPEMKEILNATITENVGLIKSIANNYLDQVQSAVFRSITTGNGLKDLQPFLEKQESISKRHAELMALDQTRKAYNNLNRGRMEKLGIEEFEWMHSGGSQHPRKLHQRMNGKIYRFDDLPIIDEKTGERGIPGQAINCKCRMRPVIKFGK